VGAIRQHSTRFERIYSRLAVLDFEQLETGSVEIGTLSGMRTYPEDHSLILARASSCLSETGDNRPCFDVPALTDRSCFECVSFSLFWQTDCFRGRLMMSQYHVANVLESFEVPNDLGYRFSQFQRRHEIERSWTKRLHELCEVVESVL